MGAVTQQERLLGELCAYRMARWPIERFLPKVKPPGEA
jgi:hypothetical protein